MNTHTETQMKSRPPQQKRLEGVETTDELRQLIRDVRSFGGHSNALQHREKDEIHPLMIPSMSRAQAVEVLRNFDTTNINVPVSVLRAIETLCTGRREYMERLDQCLQATQLAFTSPPSSEYIDSEERRKFRRRMEKLKLRDEERSYGGLVKNVGLQAMTDDVTTRSMTYAASIGLNMIVAPLSFGCFMYFFASGLFNYMGWDANRPTHLGPDIRKVIAGVVSGAIMLMVEMVLFVIRSHEMDKATRKKAKTAKPGAFGHYTSNTERHFKGE